ncbi:hypothetical protein [Conchiformibius steedae]|uniref:hypothetical protein n=1 Tax=Conchiformibius steedae TaxID=153493 RepID=UPI0011CFB7F4|nr:hypothetical protein [Conchiformibius steedae]
MTPKQLQFLRLLAKTGFITNKHLEQVGFDKTTNSNHYITKPLLDGKFIGRIMVSNAFGIGRKVVYFLVKKGAEFLADTDGILLDTIAFTAQKGGIYTTKDGESVAVIRSDFAHKEAYISAFFAALMYLQNTDYEFVDYKHYYQLKGDKGTSLKLNGKAFRPDGIWFMESLDPSAPRFVYVVEIHRHSERKHIIRQLRQQVEAIKAKSVQNRFGFEHPYLVLSIFTDENINAMQGILKELQQSDDWAIMQKYFLFARLSDILADCYNGLGYFGGNKKPFPSIII